MNKKNIRRALFFWVDKLQVSKMERISIASLLSVIVVLMLLNVFIKRKKVPAPDNHEQILAEFERRSSLLKKKQEEISKRYDPEVESSSQSIAPTQEMAEKQPERISQQELINVNTATAEELESLPGIGKTYAQRIIEYRETNGLFTNVDELVNVRGIGQATLRKLKPFIKL